MAKAYRSTTRRVVRRTEKVPAIHLVLSEGEADLLLALLAHTVPTDGKTPGKYVARLADVLEEAIGQPWNETDAGRLLDLDDTEHGVKFRPYSELPENQVRGVMYAEDRGADLDWPAAMKYWRDEMARWSALDGQFGAHDVLDVERGPSER